MADIRINALATTAASTASDDFIAVDGSANGTRKLNAYSPTFGGNLTVSGTTSTITLGSTNTGTIAVDSGGTITVKPKSTKPFVVSDATASSGIEANLWLTTPNSTNSSDRNWGIAANHSAHGSLDFFVSSSSSGDPTTQAMSLSSGGNLTVSGTGTSTFNGILNVSGSTNYLKILTTGTPTSGAAALQLSFNGTNSRAIRLTNVDTGGRTYDIITGGGGDAASFGLYDDTSGAYRMFIASSGNLLIGTTTDSANGKLQLATHTTSAGGIGFGTDTSLFRSAAGNLQLSASVTSAAIAINNVGSGVAALAYDATGALVYSTGSLRFQTNGSNTALTLDSSQNATFAGTLTLPNDKAIYFKEVGGTAQRFALNSGDVIYIEPDQLHKISIGGAGVTNVGVGGIGVAGNSVFGGSIAIGNTVQTAASVASTHKVTISIGGTTYYLLATNV